MHRLVIILTWLADAQSQLAAPTQELYETKLKAAEKASRVKRALKSDTDATAATGTVVANKLIYNVIYLHYTAYIGSDDLLMRAKYRRHIHTQSVIFQPDLSLPVPPDITGGYKKKLTLKPLIFLCCFTVCYYMSRQLLTTCWKARTSDPSTEPCQPSRQNARSDSQTRLFSLTGLKGLSHTDTRCVSRTQPRKWSQHFLLFANIHMEALKMCKPWSQCLMYYCWLVVAYFCLDSSLHKCFFYSTASLC